MDIIELCVGLDSQNTFKRTQFDSAHLVECQRTSCSILEIHVFDFDCELLIAEWISIFTHTKNEVVFSNLPHVHFIQTMIMSVMLHSELVSFHIQFFSFLLWDILYSTCKFDWDGLSVWRNHELKHKVFIVLKFWVDNLMIDLFTIMVDNSHVKLTTL